MTKRLLVSMDDERYEDLRRLAFEKKAPMADLVRHAIEKVFEDQLDVIAGQRGLDEYMKDPSKAVSLDDMLEELGVALPSRASTTRKTRIRKATRRTEASRRRSA